jgi:arabinogalactan endo-1,4-beta-galactosidase
MTGCLSRSFKMMGTEWRRVPLWFAAILGLLCASGCGGGSSGGSSPPPTVLPPKISKSFGAAQVALNGSASLTFSLSNPNTGTSLTGIGLTDTLPAGLLVATPNGLTGSCGSGTITATAGSNSVSLSGGTLASAATCNFTLNVLATATGSQNNTTSAVTSTEGGSGSTASASITVTAPSQQPTEPTDVTPLNGEVYYVLNQLSGLQVDLNDNSTSAGDNLVQEPRSFTSSSQRWAFTNLSGGLLRISNIANGLCFDSAVSSGVTYVVQNPCAPVATQQWTLTATSNGYYTITNKSTGLLIDLAQGSVSAGTVLDQTALSGKATQSQQWLLRPAFFRGVDNALLEKQEAARAASGLTWWTDAGQPQDVLEMFKDHGVNLVRLRPSSVPPYANVSQAGCSGNACYGETEAQDLDLAKRAKNLGLSVELTLLFDGGSSASVPSAWSGHTLAQLQSDVYSYVKAEIEAYRQAGTMPDLVAIGNEVDTGFLGSLGSPTGADFSGFAALQIQAMQAVKDAAADTSIGAAIPPPLTCIHITPAWNLTQFFTLANQNNIPYDAICQSYYPIYHGPLTDAQAAASNPNNKPVEQDVLEAAATAMGKPVFIIETGEHYENGFQANDPWYAPPTAALQRQFLLDLETVLKGLPSNLSMGMEYWDPAGVNIPNSSGGFINGDNLPDAIYIWNGLTLFDNADASGSTNVDAPNYSALLPGIDALGGRLDSTLSYMFINRSSGNLLSVYQASTAAGAMLDTEADNGAPTLSQQWRITSNNDGYFQIASLNPGAGGTTNVLDGTGGSTASGNAIVQSTSGGGQEQEWDIVTAGKGYFTLVNRVSGLVLDMNGGVGEQAGFAVQEPQNSSTTQQWQIVPVH